MAPLLLLPGSTIPQRPCCLMSLLLLLILAASACCALARRGRRPEVPSQVPAGVPCNPHAVCGRSTQTEGPVGASALQLAQGVYVCVGGGSHPRHTFAHCQTLP
jgi:hypothetical protein